MPRVPPDIKRFIAAFAHGRWSMERWRLDNAQRTVERSVAYAADDAACTMRVTASYGREGIVGSGAGVLTMDFGAIAGTPYGEIEFAGRTVVTPVAGAVREFPCVVRVGAQDHGFCVRVDSYEVPEYYAIFHVKPAAVRFSARMRERCGQRLAAAAAS